jgi:hypothetical protein
MKTEIVYLLPNGDRLKLWPQPDGTITMNADFIDEVLASSGAIREP